MNPRNTDVVTQVPEPETLISVLLRIHSSLRSVRSQTTYLVDKINGPSPAEQSPEPPTQNLRVVVYAILDMAQSIANDLSKSHDELGDFNKLSAGSIYVNANSQLR